jgi:hypothetical protein
MSTPEGKVKLFIDNKMKTWYPHALKYSPPGIGRFGKNGFPDRFWFIKGSDTVCVIVAIEAKAEGKEATQLQMHMLLKLKSLGCIAAVVDGKDEEHMLKIKEEIDKRIRMIQDAL